ncbi:PucR family transcriptional regulator [Mesoaciditoga lauensis]|uniref:PucR family transcriptional regulator n=1 Tax=Mesoaciditoga lauensis TaxID=1495039 RepID=UPI00056474C0|nr:helix-turn-helix domain-containing protein [Mesoaciditoga lauensis]
MILSYAEMGEKLKKITDAEVAILSEDGGVDFSTFELDEELKEAALIALKTKIRIKMSRDEGNTLVIPIIASSGLKVLILLGYAITEESFVNLILENVKCLEVKSYLPPKRIAKVEAIKSHGELIETLMLFFDNDSSIVKTSLVMNVHRNTVLYRLNKVKELTGLDPKKFKDAVKLYFALESIDVEKEGGAS